MSLVGIFFYKKYENGYFWNLVPKLRFSFCKKIKRREQNIIKLPYSNRKTENRKGKDAMPKRKVQVEGQLDLLSLNKEIEKAKKENPIPEERVAKKETSKRTRKTTTNVQKKAVPHSATPETAKKSYTKEQYAEAVQMVEDRGVIYVGVLINHFRISANTAISIMNQMRKENLVTENVALVKNTKEHKIRWGKDE